MAIHVEVLSKEDEGLLPAMQFAKGLVEWCMEFTYSQRHERSDESPPPKIRHFFTMP